MSVESWNCDSWREEMKEWYDPYQGECEEKWGRGRDPCSGAWTQTTSYPVTREIQTSHSQLLLSSQKHRKKERDREIVVACSWRPDPGFESQEDDEINYIYTTLRNNCNSHHNYCHFLILLDSEVETIAYIVQRNTSIHFHATLLQCSHQTNVYSSTSKYLYLYYTYEMVKCQLILYNRTTCTKCFCILETWACDMFCNLRTFIWVVLMVRLLCLKIWQLWEYIWLKFDSYW